MLERSSRALKDRRSKDILIMQQSHVIDIDGTFVGAAVRLECGYRIIATDMRVGQLHGSQWPTLEELRRRLHRSYRSAGQLPGDTRSAPHRSLVPTAST